MIEKGNLNMINVRFVERVMRIVFRFGILPVSVIKCCLIVCVTTKMMAL